MKNAAIAAKSAALPPIPTELIDQLVIGPMSGEAVNAASMAFKKALIERALGAELGQDPVGGFFFGCQLATKRTYACSAS